MGGSARGRRARRQAHRRAEEAVEAEAVEDGPHRVLADAIVEVAAGVVVLRKVADALHVVLVRAVQVGRARHVEGHRVGDRLQNLSAGDPRRDRLAGLEVRDGGIDVGRRAVDRVLQRLRLVRVGRLPRAEGLLPLAVLADEGALVVGEVLVRLARDEPLVGREAEALARRVGVLDARLAVRRARAGDLVDALADDGLAHDQRRLAVVRLLGVAVRLGHRVHVVAVDGEHLPALRLEAHLHVLRLRVLGHLVQRHAVRVVHEDEVVELLVARERDRLVRHALLQAAVAAEHDDVVVDDRVLRGVQGRPRELGRRGHADAVADALAERARRRLDARRPAELGVAGRLRVLHAEVLDLLHREVIARQVQPGVQEHRAVARREDEAVAVDPVGLVGVVRELLAEEHRAEVGAAEREAHVARGSLGDRVDGQTARLICGLRARDGGESGPRRQWPCAQRRGRARALWARPSRGILAPWRAPSAAQRPPRRPACSSWSATRRSAASSATRRPGRHRQHQRAQRRERGEPSVLPARERRSLREDGDAARANGQTELRGGEAEAHTERELELEVRFTLGHVEDTRLLPPFLCPPLEVLTV